MSDQTIISDVVSYARSSADSNGAGAAFWAAVREETTRIKAMKSGDGPNEISPLNPPDKRFVFIVETRSPWRHNIFTDGRQVSECELKLAAQRIAEGSHRLATTSEIERFKSDNESRRKMILAAQDKAEAKKRIILQAPTVKA